MSPHRIVCPVCRSELRITARLRFPAIFTIVGSVLGTLFLPGLLPYELGKWKSVAATMVVLAAYFFAVWPRIVRFKPWSPFQYWLPRSRLVGYTVYLLVPLAILVSIFWLAITFAS